MSGILLQHGLVAVLQLGGDRRAGEAAVDEDLAFAAERLRHPFGQHGRNAVPVRFERIGAFLGHDLVEADDHDAGVAGLLDRRVERRVGARVDQDRVRLGADDVVQRVELRLDRVLDVLDLEVDAAGERRLGHRQLGDADHLLPPVVADEIVGQIDRVFVRREAVRRAEAEHGHSRGNGERCPLCFQDHVLPLRGRFRPLLCPPAVRPAGVFEAHAKVATRVEANTDVRGDAPKLLGMLL